MANAVRVRAFAVVFVVLALAQAGAGEEGAVTLDGKALSGGVSFAGKDAVVGGARVALADLDAVDLVGEAAAAQIATPYGVWLIDGGWLPASAPRAAGAADTVAFDTPYGPVDLPLTAILGWGPVEDERPPEAPSEGDRVVADGSVIDGAIQGLGEKGLALKTTTLGDLELPLAGIQKLRLGLPAKPPRGTWLAVALDRARPPVALLPGRPLRLACAKEATLTPPDAGWRLRVEGGRRVYLSGLDPSVHEESGAFGTPGRGSATTISTAVPWCSPARATSAAWWCTAAPGWRGTSTAATSGCAPSPASATWSAARATARCGSAATARRCGRWTR